MKISRDSVLLQPRKLHIAIPLLTTLIAGWIFSIDHISKYGLEIHHAVLIAAVSIALLGFGVGHLQRVRLILDKTNNKLIWEVDSIFNSSQSHFDVNDIEEVGVQLSKVKTGYVRRPVLLFKNSKRKPFPLLTVSYAGKNAQDVQNRVNALLNIDTSQNEIEIPEEEA